jgi:SAM-dependent methyltransferase
VKQVERFGNASLAKQLSDEIMSRVRAEYTVMPRFAFHQPLDYADLTLPPVFEEPGMDSSSDLPVPSGADRFGYAADDASKYLEWGRLDHRELRKVFERNAAEKRDTDQRVGVRVLDFGCSSGRVLRHFEEEHKELQWELYGCDVQARAIEWIRRFFPATFNVVCTSTLPHLPFPDGMFDFIYGMSVFTHIKYQWDAWLLELKRVLKPGGVMIQTIHAETAWRFYAEHKDEEWVRAALDKRVYDVCEMDVEYLLWGDVGVSQVFWTRDAIERYWGRYLAIAEILEPPKMSFQDWVVCKRIS